MDRCRTARPATIRRHLRLATVAGLLMVAALPPLARAQSDVSIDSINLTAADFRRAYTSQDSTVRERARLYLLGVADATEGVRWCGYSVAKTVTLRAVVHDALEKMSDADLRQRASTVIVRILSGVYRCKRT